MAAFPVAAGPAPVLQPDLHAALRIATHDVHQRLHRHRGFAAVQDGTIDRAAYARLLRRLFGFHRAFEIAADLPPQRSLRLGDDLAALGDGGAASGPIALCSSLPVFAGSADILGGRYVVEGSALGGRGLARHLDTLLGAQASDGRRFFAGNGVDTGAVWRDYLARLAQAAPDPVARRRVIAAAIATFAAFETWLADWDTPS